MRTVIVRDATRITLGKQGENNAVRVVWAGVVDKYAKLYGEGHFELVVVQRGQAYPAVVNVDGADLVWDVRAADTATAEIGSLELIYYAGDTIVKSKTWETVVVASKSADGMTEPPEDPARAWFDAIKRQIGDLSKLTTKAKENLVAAINEAATTGSGGGSVEMRVDGGYIQYSTDGVTWENLISVVSLEGKPGKDGDPGAVFVPHLADNGDLSWSNDGGLDNPETVNIMGRNGDDGGYYTPTVSQPDANTMRVAYTPSQEGMPTVPQVDVVLPQGSPGNDGKTAYQYAQDGGYTGSETEFAAKLAAEHLPAPASAAVGQTVVVKSVDENSKPIEWKAADIVPNDGIDISRDPDLIIEVAKAVTQLCISEIDGVPIDTTEMVVLWEHPSGASYVPNYFRFNNAVINGTATTAILANWNFPSELCPTTDKAAAIICRVKKVNDGLYCYECSGLQQNPGTVVGTVKSVYGAPYSNILDGKTSIKEFFVYQATQIQPKCKVSVWIK